MYKKATCNRFLAALALVALVLSNLSGSGIAASAACDEPDFLVLNPERE